MSHFIYEKSLNETWPDRLGLSPDKGKVVPVLN